MTDAPNAYADTRVRPDLLATGDLVRVVTRRGWVLEGTYAGGWALRHGGFALSLKPRDGSKVRHVTTVEPIVVLRPA